MLQYISLQRFESSSWFCWVCGLVVLDCILFVLYLKSRLLFWPTWGLATWQEHLEYSRLHSGSTYCRVHTGLHYIMLLLWPTLVCLHLFKYFMANCSNKTHSHCQTAWLILSDMLEIKPSIWDGEKLVPWEIPFSFTHKHMGPQSNRVCTYLCSWCCQLGLVFGLLHRHSFCLLVLPDTDCCSLHCTHDTH